MNADIKRRYDAFRAKHPMLTAQSAYRSAVHPDAAESWEEDRSTRNDNVWCKEIEGFTVRLWVEDESIFPEITRGKNETDYGNYVDSRRSGYSSHEWDGNWPEPVEFAEFEHVEFNFQKHKPRRRHIRFPYNAIHYSGPGWTQGEEPGYFIPEGIEDHFDWCRRAGMSRSVALDNTRQFIEDQLTMLFSSPLTYVCVWIKVYKDEIELASTSMSTDVSGDDEGRAYCFEMIEEHGLVEDALEEARGVIAKLAAKS